MKSLNVSPKDTGASKGGKQVPNEKQFEARQTPSPEPWRPGGEHGHFKGIE